MQITTADFDATVHYRQLKIQAEEKFLKGRLTILKQWFRDLTEMQLETMDLEFGQFLKIKTGYDVDIFKSYFQRVDKIINKGKITRDNQFYDISMMIDQLCHIEPVDINKIGILNKLIGDYEKHKSQPLKKKNS